MRSLSQTLALAAALFTSVAVAVTPIEVQGRDFVDPTTKKRFMIVGADYQPGGQSGYKPQEKKDALTDKEACLRDAVMLQNLGVNTIRVYNVDPKLNHDDCASIFNAAGIYMIIDVNGPQSGESINRAEPWTSYHKDYLNRIFGVVENFKSYPNTLAFFAANEVMNDMKTGKINPQYIRAVQRDLKNYIKTHVNRKIPVAYSAADVREILEDTWAYMQCDNGDNSDSDFFGLNSYSWCGGQGSFESAGYDTLVEMFKQSSVPVFFSEYGCNEVLPRVFDEVAALYSDKMKTLSGGLVYEYSQEDNKYGLADINADGTVKLRADFDNLKAAYAKLDLSKFETLQTPVKAPKCDSKLIKNSAFDSNFTIPAVCPGCDDIIKNGIKTPLKGKIVEVKDTKCPKAVYGTKGAELKDLNLKLVSNDGDKVPSGDKSNDDKKDDKKTDDKKTEDKDDKKTDDKKDDDKKDDKKTDDKKDDKPSPISSPNNTTAPLNGTTPFYSNGTATPLNGTAKGGKKCSCKGKTPGNSTVPGNSTIVPPVTPPVPSTPASNTTGVPSTNQPPQPPVPSSTPALNTNGATALLASGWTSVLALGLAALMVL